MVGAMIRMPPLLGVAEAGGAAVVAVSGAASKGAVSSLAPTLDAVLVTSLLEC
jgi:hypothetical protein